MLINDSGVVLTTSALDDPVEAIVDAICRAPSGGNVQPWHITIDDYGIYVRIAWDRTSLMDIDYRGSYVAIGAALFNAKTAVGYHGLGVRITTFPEGTNSDLVFSIEFADDRSSIDRRYASTYRGVLARSTNRHFGGKVRKLSPKTVSLLERAAGIEGARLHLVSHRDDVAALAAILAESDRIRYLTPRLHEEMMSELVDEPSGQGIAVDTLALPVYDRPKLRLLRDWDVMQALLGMSDESDDPVGEVLGVSTRDRILASSAIAVLTVDGDYPEHYLRGGTALQRFWVQANQCGLGVHPVSPVFLYAHSLQELAKQSPQFCGELDVLQSRFEQVMMLRPDGADRPILVLRLSHQVPETTRSRRLSRQYAVTDLR